MRWFCKCGLIVAAVAVTVGAFAAPPAEPVQPDKKAKEKAAKAEGGEKKERRKRDKDKDKEKDKKKKGDKAEGGDSKGKLSLPLVEGHDSRGLKIPYFDANGKLQMMFVIGVATRIDENRVQMKETIVETYRQDGSPELSVELPTSVLDLNTKVVTSDVPTTIRRDDFELKGDSVAFDTANRHGKLVGNVRMIIYNLENELDKSSDAKSDE